jgi:hypothetical protein
MTISEYITAAKDILVGLSAVAAAVFAYMGLTTWRKELKGKSEYQLAKEVLKSVYKVRDAFNHVRNPAIFQYEYPEQMLDNAGYLKQENEYDDAAYVYEKRWEVMAKAFNELEEHHLEAQVEWGAEFRDVITKLRSCKVELQIAIQQMLERKKNPSENMPNSAEELAQARSILYFHGSESKHDKFTPEIDEAINEFEKWLRPHIKR